MIRLLETGLVRLAFDLERLEFHRWSLRGFLEWADSEQGTQPAAFTRAGIEAYHL